MHPLEPLRLRLAGDRAAGVAFDQAWPAALELAPASWHDALQATRAAWGDAYNRPGRPQGLAAVAVLREAAVDDDPAAMYRRGRRRATAGGLRLVA